MKVSKNWKPIPTTENRFANKTGFNIPTSSYAMYSNYDAD